MNFGEVFSRAWNIIWKYKILWVFGLLASLGSSTPDLQSRFRFDGGRGRIPLPGVQRFFENLPPWVWILLIFAGLVIFVIFVLLSTIGRAGLIRGAWLADAGETNLPFSRLFSEAQGYFIRLLLLGLLIAGVALSVALVITLSAVLTLGIAMLCLLPLFCLMVPILILAGVIIDLSMIAIVGENRGVIEGLKRGWEVARSHVAEIIFMAVIVVIGNAVATFIVGLPALLILGPILAAVITRSEIIANGGIILSIMLFLFYLPILLAARAVITSYVETVWTVTFRRLTGHPQEAAAPVIVNEPV